MAIPPILFSSGLRGINSESGVVVLAFEAPLPLDDQQALRYEVNARIALPIDRLRNMVAFLVERLEEADSATVHQAPEQTQ